MTRRRSFYTLILFCLALPGSIVGAQDLEELPHTDYDDSQVADWGVVAKAASVSMDGITSHFRSWLSSNGYSGYDFARDDLDGGSYGGKTSASDPISKQPVIFIHGNSDKAVGDTVGQTGWSDSIAYFLGKGYTSAELYATTWGPASASLSAAQYHSKTYLTKLRAFVEAVLDYTGASKVDIITHSMGVTLGRKVVLGGWAHDSLNGGWYQLGGSLTSQVDTFVGIAGANQGLVSCYMSGGSTPTCGSTNGLYPGYLIGIYGPYGVSDILDDINGSYGYEGAYVFSIWSTVDEIIGYGNLVYGEYTSRIPGQDGEKVFSSVPYGHFNSKDLTAYYQWRMVTSHVTN